MEHTTVDARTPVAAEGGPAVAPATPRGRGFAAIACAAALGSVLVWSFWPNLVALAEQWDRDPNYSYGYLVAPIAAVILWSRRDQVSRVPIAPWWWGFLPLAFFLLARYWLYEWNEQYEETALLPIVAACLVLTVGGWRLLWACLPALGFLVFLLPLPRFLNQLVVGPLQQIATKGSVTLMEMLGLPVLAEGNVILVGAETLEVARACNGLSMLLSFVVLITAVVILVERPWYERLVLLLSAVPIALTSNILRIAATAMVYHYVGHDWGERLAHDFAGWAMMPVALLLVLIELKILSTLFIEEEVVVPRNYLRRGPGTARPEPNA